MRERADADADSDQERRKRGREAGTLTDARFASTEIIKSGMVLNALTAISHSQPIVCARRISDVLLPKFFHTCTPVAQYQHPYTITP